MKDPLPPLLPSVLHLSTATDWSTWHLFTVSYLVSVVYFDFIDPVRIHPVDSNLVFFLPLVFHLAVFNYLV